MGCAAAGFYPEDRTRPERPGEGSVTVAVMGGSQVDLLGDIEAFARANGLTCSIQRLGSGVEPFVVFSLKSDRAEVLGSNPIAKDTFPVFFTGAERGVLRSRFLSHLSGKGYVRRLR